VGKKRTKAELQEALDAAEEKVAELQASLESAPSAAAGVSRAPLGAPAGPPLYVRVSRTFKWRGARVGVGVCIVNPDLSLLKAGHGNWEWVPSPTWEACKRKCCCVEGSLQPWAPPGR
jgi:hypothetical protein